MHTKVYKQGILMKQGGTNGGYKMWRKRWFVFHSEGISYYKSEKAYLAGAKELGFLHMDSNFNICHQDEFQSNYFRIVATARTLIVKSTSHETKLSWLRILPKVQKEASAAGKFLKGEIASPRENVVDSDSDDEDIVQVKKKSATELQKEENEFQRQLQ